MITGAYRKALALIALVMISASACGADVPLSPTPTVKEKPMSGLMSSRPRIPQVAPVMIGAVRYEPTVQTTTPGPEHAPGVLGAYDATTGVRLWTLNVYTRSIDSRIEADVQEDHIKCLTATSDGKLQIVTETGRRYEVDPDSRSARALP